MNGTKAPHFEHGVASGDPHADSVVLWTRVTPGLPHMQQALTVVWSVRREGAEVAERTGSMQTDDSRDWTVKVIVDGLSHSVRYEYSFSSAAVHSPRGRFRLPPPLGMPLASLRYAIFSCSSWSSGYFNAYAAAARAPLDFWVHLGDYIYENGADGHYGPHGARAVRTSGLQPQTELVTLSDYRARHGLHRQEAELQALSAASPLIAVWDDHEIGNDVSSAGPRGGRSDGSWWVRKRSAIRAYHEWMPTRVRPPPPCVSRPGSVRATADELARCEGSHAGENIFRHFYFGSLAALSVLETRLLARSRQGVSEATAQISDVVEGWPMEEWASEPRVLQPLGELNASWHEVRQSPDRQLMGVEQQARPRPCPCPCPRPRPCLRSRRYPWR